MVHHPTIAGSGDPGRSSALYRDLLKLDFPGSKPVRPEDLVASKTQEAYAYWLSKNGASALPLASALDPIDIARLLTDCALFEVVDGDDFKERIVGEGLKANVFPPGVGKHVSEWAKGEEKFWSGLLMALRVVRDHKVPLGLVGDQKGNHRPTVVTESILLPFVSEAGAVSRIISIVAYFEPQK